MALTGVFNADFSEFYTAVEQAKIKLVEFDSGAQDVEKSLNAMVESLSGKQLMQDAAEMTRAIEKMGGVGRLTANELATFGPKIQEAVEKAKLMGEEVPKSMQKIADQTKQTNLSVKDLIGSVQGIAGAFGIALTAQGLINFGKQILETADHLVTLSERLGMTTTQVQQLQYIAETSGTNLDAMAQAAGNLKSQFSNLKVQDTLRDMGLSVQQLKAANPYEMLQQVGKGLAEISDKSEQAEKARALFGRGWQEILNA